MKKQILLPLFCLFASTLLAQDLPSATTLLAELGILDNPNGEMMLPDSSHGYFFDISIQDSLLAQRQFIDWNEHAQIKYDSTLFLYPDSISLGWLYYEKKEYTYDNLARLIEQNEYDGWYDLNEWTPSYRYFTHYLNTSLLIDYDLTHYYESDISAWRNDDSTIYTRNIQQQIDSSYRFAWLEDSGYYAARNYHSFGYNAQGLESSDTTFYFETPGIATLSGLELSTYDNNGQEIEEFRYYWSQSNQAWVNSEWDIFAYDINGNITTVVNLDWDEGLSEWVREDSLSLIYNEDNSIHFWKIYNWEGAGIGWDKRAVLEYFNSLHFVVGTEELMPAEPMKLYPNPCMGQITLVSAYDGIFEIHNINGQLLRSYQLPAGKHLLDLSELKAGIYIISSSSGNKPQKIIIQ